MTLVTVAAEAAPIIRVENDAGLPPAEIESVVKDFRAWAVRVYAYTRSEPGPVTLQLTRKVPFGFYRDRTVLMPPSKDRWEMLDNWVHELTHHATGHDSSFFFKEGIAVHTLEKLFAEEGRVPQTWPQFGQSTDAWVALYRARGKLPSLKQALTWPRYLREDDFGSWQIYNIAGSFVGWYLATYGHAAFHEAFAQEWPEQDSGELERRWLAALAAKKPKSFDPQAVLSRTARYQAYARRLR